MRKLAGFRLVFLLHNRGATPMQQQPTPRSSAVVTATRFIETHFADPITTASVARLVGRERTYFATAFRQQTGQTIHRYVVSVRLRHALSRLADGEKVEAAMLAAGYRSKRSFYRDFRSRLGATPGVYRDTLRR
jgi:AraC-like DNA-binding protein